ncbi:MAG: cell wall protein [Hyalangium sp.]|uniref:cell wall protein n=1 Tax=Hyalangium sp. TaxID=2028555 RepID=UPI003899CA25
MSFEKALREMIRGELAAQLSPLQKSIAQLERGLDSLQALRNVTGQLAPLLAQRGREVVLRHAQTQAPPQRAAPARAPEAAPAPRAKAAPTSGFSCAVSGCRRPARSKGYCSAHYQKLRLLIRTNRRPADWVDDAPPQSARDMKLPRGRAAARDREPEPVAPKEPPKPKAWVRKKGSAEKVSLN